MAETKPERKEARKMENKRNYGNVSAEKNQPEKKISTGAISATIWQNEAKMKDGKTSSYRTVTLQRRYLDKNNEWQTSTTMRASDLPKAALVLTKAFEYIVLRDSDSTASQEGMLDEEIVI